MELAPDHIHDAMFVPANGRRIAELELSCGGAEVLAFCGSPVVVGVPKNSEFRIQNDIINNFA